MSIIWEILSSRKDSLHMLTEIFTYQEVYRRVCKLCTFIKNLDNLNHKYNIGIIAPLSIEYVEVNYISVGLSCILIHLNIDIEIKKIIFSINQNKIKLLFVDYVFVNILKEIEYKISDVQYIIWINKPTKFINNRFINYFYIDILDNIYKNFDSVEMQS